MMFRRQGLIVCSTDRIRVLPYILPNIMRIYCTIRMRLTNSKLIINAAAIACPVKMSCAAGTVETRIPASANPTGIMPLEPKVSTLKTRESLSCGINMQRMVSIKDNNRQVSRQNLRSDSEVYSTIYATAKWHGRTPDKNHSRAVYLDTQCRLGHDNNPRLWVWE